MERKWALALVLALLLAMTACSGDGGAEDADAPAETGEAASEATADATGEPAAEPADDTAPQQPAEDLSFEIGQEKTVGPFTFTVTEVGVSESICIEQGERMGLASEQGDEIAADEGYGWLYYAVEYAFAGDQKMPAKTSFLPSVSYGDYTFAEKFLTFVYYDASWHGLTYQNTAYGMLLPSLSSYEYDPFVDRGTYLLHGAVQVPLQAAEDTGTPMILSLRIDREDGTQTYAATEVRYEPPKAPVPDERLLTFTYEDREFFKEYVQGLEPMAEEAVRTALTDVTFSMRNNYGGDGDGTHTITFFGDGTLDATYEYEGARYSMFESWRIEDGKVVLTHTATMNTGETRTTDTLLTPYQYDETRYLLIDEVGDYSMVLTAQA